MNPHKLVELRELLAAPDIDLVSLADIPGATAPDEPFDTLVENARHKARVAASFTGLAATADDTGLEVEALEGRPGARAARYAGPGATAEDNVAKLLGELREVRPERRRARFRTVCVVALPDGREVVAEGVLEGRITEAPRGLGGFGYDPVFELPDGRTLAELGPGEKNERSHRGQAVRKLRAALERLSP
jgi:XTP/dITP diphosphohydrolase